MAKKKLPNSKTDLDKFSENYSERIKKFLNQNPETCVVFLDGDFGWGKTKFIEENLKVPKNQIFSP